MHYIYNVVTTHLMNVHFEEKYALLLNYTL